MLAGARAQMLTKERARKKNTHASTSKDTCGSTFAFSRGSACMDIYTKSMSVHGSTCLYMYDKGSVVHGVTSPGNSKVNMVV